jgi:hypothetical protein
MSQPSHTQLHSKQFPTLNYDILSIHYRFHSNLHKRLRYYEVRRPTKCSEARVQLSLARQPNLGQILEPFPVIPWGSFALAYLGVPVVLGVRFTVLTQARFLTNSYTGLAPHDRGFR